MWRGWPQWKIDFDMMIIWDIPVTKQTVMTWREKVTV